MFTLAHVYKNKIPNQKNLPVLGDEYTGTYALLREALPNSETGIPISYPESDLYEFSNINGFPALHYFGSEFNINDHQTSSTAITPYFNNENMPGSRDVTISYWFYLKNELNDPNQYILATNRNYDGYNKFYTFKVGYNTFQYISYERNYDNNPGPLNLDKLITANEWHNIIATNNDRNISIWFDGIKYSQTISSSGFYLGQAVPKFISIFANNIECYLSTILIYGRSITDQEAKQIYGY